MGIIADARKRQEFGDPAKSIDYARMQKRFPVQKAALTRAVKTGDPEKVAAACKAAVAEWDDIGAWPDDWARWQRALDGSLPFGQSVDIRHL